MNYLKFNFLTLSILILIFSTAIFSQQADSSKQKDSPLHAGSWSMQFSYSRLSFGSFKGGNISAKYHFTDKSALRFGVDIYADNSTKDVQRNSAQSTYSGNQNLDNSFIDIGITTDYIYYFSTTKPVNFFISSGTTFGIGHSSNGANISSGIPDTLRAAARVKSNRWFVKANFSVGVEWLITSNFSIHGEYQTALMYQYTKTQESRNESVPDAQPTYSNSILKSFRFLPAGALIGVSLYF